MFAYYAKWIPDFSDKITALTNTNVFPLSPTPLATFNTLKKELERASLNPIDESLPFVIECDASEVAVSATLNQDGRPVVFMSRTLQNSELHYPPVEKEVTAIIEAVGKWNHFLACQCNAYPLPRIDTMINKLAQYKVFLTHDLKNAYHQIPISQAERKYTAFEAGGQLYQFCHIQFGVTNGVAVFQRLMDKIIKEEELNDTFPYLDDITVGDRTQEEHDSNVKAFLEVVQRRHLTLNHSKSVLSALSITVLGYLVEHSSIKPDPDILHPLQNLPPPHLYVHSAEAWACLLTTQNEYLISPIRLQL